MKAFTKANRTIAIVGGSFGGQNVVQNLIKLDPRLAAVKVVWVDKLARLTASESSKEQQQKTVSSESMVQSFEQPNLSFVQGSLTKVVPEDNKILVARKDGKVEEIGYDSLVITTGQFKSGLWQSKEESNRLSTEEQGEWEHLAEKVESANSILCVGGGITGVELAALFKEEFPSKKVALAHKDEKILAHTEGLHDQTMPILQGLGVEVLLNTTFSSGSDLENDFDLVLNCQPGETLTPKKFLQGRLQEAVEPVTGQIMVNSKFMATNVHPVASMKPETERVWSNIFGFGDCALTPANESKELPLLRQLGPLVANNAYQVATQSNMIQKVDEASLQKAEAETNTSNYLERNGVITPNLDAFQRKLGLRDQLFEFLSQNSSEVDEPKVEEHVEQPHSDSDELDDAEDTSYHPNIQSQQEAFSW